MPTDKLEDFILNHREEFNNDVPTTGLWDRIEQALEPEGDDDNDPLSAFVATHREDFDVDSPPPRLEAQLFATLDAAGATPAAPAPATTLRAVRGSRLRLIGMAATVALLIAAAFTLGNYRGYQAAEGDQVAEQLRQMDPELAEAEDYFRAEIRTQQTKVELVSNDPQLQADLAAIDAATAEIRADLLEVPVSQRPALVEQLIETYRTKLDILLRIQQHLPPPAAPSALPQTSPNEL